MENIESQKMKQRKGNDRKRTARTKNNNLPDLSGPTRKMNVPADIACKINETHKPLYHDKVLTTGKMYNHYNVSQEAFACIENLHFLNLPYINPFIAMWTLPPIILGRLKSSVGLKWSMKI